MTAITIGGFEEFINDQFLVGLYKRTNIIYGNSVRAQEISKNTECELALPGMLGLINSIAKRMVKELTGEKRGIFDALIHDLKSILTAVMGNAQMAKKSWDADDHDTTRQNLGNLEKATYLSRNLVIDTGNHMIASQVKEGRMYEAGLGDKKIQEIIQIALNLSNPRKIGNSYVNVLAPATVRHHSAELVRILLNIFNNAYDAMAVKQYETESPSLKIYTDIHCNWLDIEVKDNGIGMSPETVERVFEENFTTKKERGGRGIGLHFCKKIVEERIGGKLAVLSDLGRGTTVNIKIPLV